MGVEIFRILHPFISILYYITDYIKKREISGYIFAERVNFVELFRLSPVYNMIFILLLHYHSDKLNIYVYKYYENDIRKRFYIHIFLYNIQNIIEWSI